MLMKKKKKKKKTKKNKIYSKINIDRGISLSVFTLTEEGIFDSINFDLT
jgi:hypothetical protein